jgi:hypothetical protein
MDCHILLFLLLVFLVMIRNTNTIIEGHGENLETTTNYSTIAREKIQQFRRDLDGVVDLDDETMDHILRNNILKAQLLSDIKNHSNPEVVTNSGNYNQEIIDILNELMTDVDEERIEIYDGNKEELRGSINDKVAEDIVLYGNRVEVITKKYLDRKYRDLEGQYKTLLSSNQCEGAEKKARKEEKDICSVKLTTKEDEISVKEKEIKELGKKIAQAERIKKKMKSIDRYMNRIKRISPRMGGYCGGRTPGRHRRHCGGRTVNKNTCNKTYKKYRGKNLQCQWNHSRRSCDFWQPGRPNTKKLC